MSSSCGYRGYFSCVSEEERVTQLEPASHLRRIVFGKNEFDPSRGKNSRLAREESSLQILKPKQSFADSKLRFSSHHAVDLTAADS